MNRRNAARADIEKTWTSLAELKEELYQTEKKITDSQKISFVWNKSTTVQLKSDRSTVKSNSKHNIKRKIFTRPVGNIGKDDTKITGRKSELHTNGAGHDHQLHVIEDQPKQPLLRTPSENSKDVRQRLISSLVKNVTLRISSDDTDASSDSVSRKQFHFNNIQPPLSRYSVRDISTQTRFVNGILPFTQDQNTNGGFSEWEKNFLQREIVDTKHSENGIINPSCLEEINSVHLDNPHSKPSIKPGEPRPKLQPTITLPGGLEKVKGLIERQREKHEKALSEVDFGDFLNLKPGIDNTEVKTVANDDLGSIRFPTYSQTFLISKPESFPVPEKIDAEVQVKPPVVRKTALVPYPLEYKGFSTHPKKEVKPVQNEDNVKNSENREEPKSARNANAGRKGISSKRQKKMGETKTSAKKKEISPFSWRVGQKLIFKELGPVPNVPSKEEGDEYGQQSSTVHHDSSSSLSDIHSLEEHGDSKKFPSSNAVVISDEVDMKDEVKSINSKNDDKENNVPHTPQLSPKDVELRSVAGVSPTFRLEPPNIIKDGPESVTVGETPASECGSTSRKMKMHNNQVPDNDNVIDLNKVVYLDISTPPTKGSPKQPSVTKKRKATKQPEQKGPSPKIRHYDQEKVREYIQKQKSERRKKVQEEKQKLSDMQTAKKERLQRLYDYQRSATKTVAKTKVPQVSKMQHNNTKVVRRADNLNVPKDMVENLQSLQKAQCPPEKVSSPQLAKKKSVLRVPPNAERSVHMVPSQVEKPSVESKEVAVNNVGQEVLIAEGSALHDELDFSQPVSLSDPSNAPPKEGMDLPSSLSTSPITPTASVFINHDRSQDDCGLQTNHFAAVNSEKGEELKSMALSIQHLFEKQMENLLRTKSLVPSKPVLSKPSNGFMISLDEGHPVRDAAAPDQRSNSVEALGESGSYTSFRERLPGVGSMQELYSRLLENDSNSFLKQPDGKEPQAGEKSLTLDDSNVESEGSLSEGPIDSEEDFPGEIDGHLGKVSLNDRSDRITLGNTLKSHHISSAVKSSDKYSLAAFVDKQKPVPDPFNFINTYMRKPLTIPSSLDVTGTTRKEKGGAGVSTGEQPESGKIDANHISRNGTASYTPDFTGSRGESSLLQSHRSSRSTMKEVNSDFTVFDERNSPLKNIESDAHSEKSVSSVSISASSLSKHSVQSSVESKPPSLHLDNAMGPTNYENPKISERTESPVVSPEMKEIDAKTIREGKNSHSIISSDGFEPLSKDMPLSSVKSETSSVPGSVDDDHDKSLEEQISRSGSSTGTASMKSDIDILNAENASIKSSAKNNNDDDDDSQMSSIEDVSNVGILNAENSSTKGSTKNSSDDDIQSQMSSIKDISNVDILSVENSDTKGSAKNSSNRDIQSQVSSIKENSSVEILNMGNAEGKNSTIDSNDDDVQSQVSSIQEVSDVDVIPVGSADTGNSPITDDSVVHSLKNDDKVIKSATEMVSSVLSQGPLNENSIPEESSVVLNAHDDSSENIHDDQKNIIDEMPHENESQIDTNAESNSEKEEPDSVSFSPKVLDYTANNSVPKILTSTQIMPNGQNRPSSVLDGHLRSNLTHLDVLQNSLVELAGINRIPSGVSRDGTQDSIAVSQVLQVNHPVGMASDQMFSTHMVTRVATEAATAAATSAVIAVLETQKSLLHKKQYLSSTDREASPSSKNGSYRYGSDFEASPKSGDVSPAASEQSKTLTEGDGSSMSHSDRERSISEVESESAEDSHSGSRYSISEQISEKSPRGSQVSTKSSEAEPISTKSSKASNVSQKISSRISVDEQIRTKSSAAEPVLSKSSIMEQISPVGSFGENVSNKSSSKQISSDSNIAEVVSNLINVREPTLEKKRKRSGNVSSPSPASLSDDDLLSSATISSSSSSITQSSNQSLEFQSVLSEDSFAQLTLDMVRRMSREEELRAKHQLSVLQFQEKSLVEKARAEMTWLEVLKRKLKQKGAEEEKISKVNKRQQELALRLRQERAQLRCMQETYRSVSKRSQALITEKKKLLTDSKILGFEFSGKKERIFGSPHNSHDKNSEILSVVKSQSRASSTTTTASIATEENNEIVDEASSPEIPENVPSSSNVSSAESLVEAQVTSQSKASHLSSSKTSKSSQQITTRHLKSELASSSRLSHQPSRPHDSVMQSLKKLEASKRYLTRKEQRLLQRRKEAESILQWQKKLDNEEMAIKELERKVLDTIDGSRRKKYIISSSNSNVHHENSSNGDSVPQSVKGSGLKDEISTDMPSHTLATSQIKTSSVPTETLHQTVASGDSIDEQLSAEKQSESVSEETMAAERKSSESSVKEEYSNIIAESSSENIPEEDISHDPTECNLIEEANSFKSSAGSHSPKENLSILSTNTYSESFESGSDTQNSSVTILQPKSSSSVNGTTGRKTHGITIRSPLIPRSHRRHDSSGSDDSYTISHSETASDQSDIEGRIHALTEELKSRRAELEKLKRERKKKYREQLKEKEKSLQKQLEAYDQHIQQTRLELEQQLEAASLSPPHSLEYTPSAVKPQIKKPCVAESRRLCKQASVSPEASPSEKKGSESLSRNSVNNKETSHDESDDTRNQSSLPKKFSVSGNKVPYKDVSSEEDNHSAPSISAENSSIPSSTTSDKNVDRSHRLENSGSLSSDDVPGSHESAKRQSLEDEKKSEENSGDEIPEEVLHSVSDKSISSNKTLQNESSEGDSLTDSHATISEGLLPDEDVMNVTASNKVLDNSHVSPCCESASDKPLVPNLDETFIVEKHDDTFIVDRGDNNVECDVLVTEVAEDKLNNETPATVSATESQGTSSPHSQKSDVLVIIDQLVCTLCNDAIFCMFQVGQKKQDTGNKMYDLGAKGSLSSALEKSHSLRDIHEKAAIQVSEMLTESLLGDAVKVILNVCKKGHFEDAPQPVQATSRKFLDILASLDGKKTSSGKSRPQDLMILSPSLDDDFAWVDENLPSSELLKSTHSGEGSGLKCTSNEKDVELDFVADQEWFEDEFVTANNQSQAQQLEQQLLQQYPYYYRQIPNKPPPPYTPPSSSSVATTSVVPFSAPRPKKPAEPVAIIPCTQEAISKVIDDAVDTLLGGIQSGLSVADILPQHCDVESPEEDIVLQCQQSYKNFLFDLAKECALDLYGETVESPKPWIRHRRLTRKPQLPQDKEELTKSIQKEVFSVLKLPMTQTQEVPPQKGSLWSAMKLGRKKRDFVDNILISELKDEEPDWVNYDRDELTVKFQLSDAICDVLLDETVKSILHMHAINEVPAFMCPHR